MHNFRSALTALANLNITGVNVNYDIDAVPSEISRGQLPALLVLPIRTDDESRSLFGERGQGFEAIAFNDGAKTVTYSVTHLLLVAPESAGSGIKSHLPTLITLVDNYIASISADVTLGGALIQPTQVRVETGMYEYGERVYVGCAFRHTWRMEV